MSHVCKLSAVLAGLWLFSDVAGAEAVATVVGESRQGSIEGRIVDAQQKPLAQVTVSASLVNAAIVTSAPTNAQGQFRIGGLMPGHYTVQAIAGADSATATIEVGAEAANVGTVVVGAAQLQAVQVTAARLARARNALSPTTGSSQYVFDQKAIQSLPEGDHTPFNRLLLQAPGVANDGYGQLHVRGDHNDIQYRLNGIALPEGVSGFGQVLDPRFAKSVTLNTGALPAQYGLRTAGVVEIATKDHLDGGTVDLYGGSHGTVNPSLQYGWTSGAWSGYLTGQYLTSNLGVENPTDKSNALHDNTQQGKAFGYFSRLLDERTKLSAIVASTSTRLQIPNNPGQQPNADFVTQLNAAGIDTAGLSSSTLNERQFERNLFGVLALQGLLDDGLNYQLALFDRQSTVEFKPDVVGDLAFNGVAAQIHRRANTVGLQGDLSYEWREAHTLSAGWGISTEDDRADNASQVFTTDANGNVNGGPVAVIDDNGRNGNTLLSLYAQDKWEPTDALTVNYGLRYDQFDAFVSGSQLSPRIGLVERLTPKTTLHAGYARYFTPPPNELVSDASLGKFAGTTNAPVITTNFNVRPERSHYFDAGLVQQVDSHLTLGIDAYYRLVRNLLDEGRFGQALVFTPFNYDRGHLYGVELTGNYRVGNFSSYLNISRASAKATQVVSGEFNFDPADLAYLNSHYVYLDHDQRLTVSSGASYRWHGTTYGVVGIYGSGLRRDLVDGAGNTVVPNGAKVPFNLQFDLSATRTVHVSEGIGDLDLRLAALNVLDRRNALHDGTGIGVGAPQFGPRAALYFGVAKSFGTF